MELCLDVWLNSGGTILVWGKTRVIVSTVHHTPQWYVCRKGVTGTTRLNSTRRCSRISTVHEHPKGPGPLADVEGHAGNAMSGRTVRVGVLVGVGRRVGVQVEVPEAVGVLQGSYPWGIREARPGIAC
jgi:hypothetical protein